MKQKELDKIIAGLNLTSKPEMIKKLNITRGALEKRIKARKIKPLKIGLMVYFDKEQVAKLTTLLPTYKKKKTSNT